jgi:hypothetical protein
LPVYFVAQIIVPPEEKVRYLGVYLDKMLSFEDHVRERCHKTVPLINIIKRLGKTKEGLTPRGAKTILTTVVLPSLLYGSELW